MYIIHVYTHSMIFPLHPYYILIIPPIGMLQFRQKQFPHCPKKGFFSRRRWTRLIAGSEAIDIYIVLSTQFQAHSFLQHTLW